MPEFHRLSLKKVPSPPETIDDLPDDDSRSVASCIMSRSGDVITRAFSRRNGVPRRPSVSVVRGVVSWKKEPKEFLMKNETSAAEVLPDRIVLPCRFSSKSTGASCFVEFISSESTSCSVSLFWIVYLDSSYHLKITPNLNLSVERFVLVHKSFIIIQIELFEPFRDFFSKWIPRQ